MYETEKGNKFQNYLENLIGDESEGKIEIWAHKSKIVVEDVNTFHKIAQKMKIDEISKTHGGIHYIEEIEGCPWTICLDDGLSQSFLDKYGKNYQIE